MVKMQNNPVKGIWMDGHAVNKITVTDTITGEVWVAVDTFDVDNVLSSDYCVYNDDGESTQYIMKTNYSVRAIDSIISLDYTKVPPKNKRLFTMHINSKCQLYIDTNDNGTATLYAICNSSVHKIITADASGYSLRFGTIYSKLIYIKDNATYELSLMVYGNNGDTEWSTTFPTREEYGSFSTNGNNSIKIRPETFRGNITSGIQGR